MKKIFGLMVMVACGDDEVPVQPDPGGAATITLAMPASLDVGAPLIVGWTTTDVGAGDRVVLSLRGASPEPMSASSAGYLFTGSAPASVPLGNIAADGTLSTEPVSLSDGGEVTVTLPSAAEGDWAVDALLMRGDDIVTATSATTWVSSGGMRLVLDRTWAESGDYVRAQLQTRATTEPLRLSAWLTTPNDTVLALPGLVDQYVPLREGMFADESLPILEEQLGKLGTGRYLLSARFETLAGEERGSVGAVLQICDEPGTIRGTVTDADGQPISSGSVTALELHDRASFTAELDAAGAYSISVPAGTWMVAGAGGAAIVDVACNATTDVAYAGKPSPRVASRKLRVGDSDRRNIRILFQAGTTPSNLDQGNFDLLVDGMTTVPEVRVPGITSFSNEDTRAAYKYLLIAQLLGADEHIDLSGDIYNQTADFVLQVTANTKAPGFLVTATLIDLTNGSVISRNAIEVANEDELAANIDTVLVGMIPSVDELWARLGGETPPILISTWFDSSAVVGSMARGTIRICNPETGEGIPNAAIKVVIEPDGEPTMIEGTSDEAGVVEVAFAVPMADKIVLRATTTATSKNIVVKSAPDILVPLPANGAAHLERAVLAAGGQGTVMHVKLRPTDAGVANLSMGVRTTGGIEALGPTTVTLDGQGAGRLDVRSTTQSGPAKVILETVMFAGEPYTAVARGYVVPPISITASVAPSNNIINDGFVEIRGEVVSNGQPVSVPVAIAAQGSGTVATRVKSDARGQFVAIYQAPATGTGATSFKLSVVKDSIEASTTTSVTYGPPCTNCPLAVFPPTGSSIARDGTKLFIANRPVTWSASRGSIEANGRFTAPGLGGVSRITATSVADPNVTLTVAVIEECTFAEVVANQIPFTGDVVATSTWDAQYDSSCLKVKLSMQAISQDDAAVFDHQQNCGGSQGINGGFGGVSVEACQISFSEVAPCGQLSRISWSPDLDSDGLDKRRYASFLAAPDCSSVLYSATGVLSR